MFIELGFDLFEYLIFGFIRYLGSDFVPLF